MHDVDAAAVLAAQLDQQADGVDLGLIGARGEISGVALQSRSAAWSSPCIVDRSGKFGVREQQEDRFWRLAAWQLRARRDSPW